MVMSSNELMYPKVKKVRKNAAKPKKVTEKRKRVVLNFVQKEEIIRKVKEGYTLEKLSLDYGCSKQSIYDFTRAQ